MVSSSVTAGHKANQAVQHGGWYRDGGITAGHVGLMLSHDRDGLALLGLHRQELYKLLDVVNVVGP